MELVRNTALVYNPLIMLGMVCLGPANIFFSCLDISRLHYRRHI